MPTLAAQKRVCDKNQTTMKKDETKLTGLYPLLFESNFHATVWGGNHLKPMKGLAADDEPVGESWEVSAVPSSKSVVSNGPLAGQDLATLTREYGPRLTGEAVSKQYGEQFPILVKFIDAAKDLSIQVHPDDTLARQRHDTFGKTEMWYVIKSAPGAKLYSGFRAPITKEEYCRRIEEGSICDVLAAHAVKPGDVFFIPAGRVHAICGGILLAEVQQSSDVTYRIFDYNRPGLDGKPRQLHTELAKDAIDYRVYDDYCTRYEHCLNAPVPIVVNKYFVVNLLEVNIATPRALRAYDSFVIYVCVEGDCIIRVNSRDVEGEVQPVVDTIELAEGYSCLVPACVADLEVTPHNANGTSKLLEVYIDNRKD